MRMYADRTILAARYKAIFIEIARHAEGAPPRKQARVRAASENANFAAPDGAAVIILKLRTRGVAYIRHPLNFCPPSIHIYYKSACKPQLCYHTTCN